MLKRIAIVGLGPHADFKLDLDPSGVHRLRGPSEVGKSFLIEAVCLALWGQSSHGRFRPEAIHDAHSKAIVELTLAGGQVVSRSITRSRSTSRWIATDEGVTTYKKEDDFAAAIGGLGADPEAVRLVVVPLAWVALASGNARKLRDVLARVLPEGDLAAEVGRLMAQGGFGVSMEEAAMSESEVSALRRRARQVRDESAGALTEVRKQIERLGQAPPAEGTLADADLVGRVTAWQEYEQRAGAQQLRLASVAAQQEWDARRRALGEAPAVAPAHMAAPTRHQLATQAQTAAKGVLVEVTGRFQLVSGQLATFSAGTDVCPMCQRAGWEQGAVFAAQLQTQLVGVQGEYDNAVASHSRATAEATESAAALESARQATGALSQWNAAEGALGPRPEVPRSEQPSVEMPTTARPTADEISTVREAQAATSAAAALRSQRQGELASAREREATQDEAHALLQIEAQRADALLDAVRKAPSLIATRQVAALGELGPVSVEFGDNPAVTVLIDGRPHWLASRGRQVVADAWLRHGLRRAMGMLDLPLFIDNVQDVAGQPMPDLPGPVFLLETADGDGIEVS